MDLFHRVHAVQVRESVPGRWKGEVRRSVYCEVLLLFGSSWCWCSCDQMIVQICCSCKLKCHKLWICFPLNVADVCETVFQWTLSSTSQSLAIATSSRTTLTATIGILTSTLVAQGPRQKLLHTILWEEGRMKGRQDGWVDGRSTNAHTPWIPWHQRRTTETECGSAASYPAYP